MVPPLLLIVQELAAVGEVGRLAFPTYTPVIEPRLERNPLAQRPAYSSPVRALSGRLRDDGACSGDW
jgi:hypothetical protein